MPNSVSNILVSVIIPTYNCEKYICQAIDSALSQQVPLEIIVINDCSTDATEEVIKTYSSNEAIRYYKNEQNLGASGSRNHGITLAKGKYIAFLDADDWWEPDKLKKQLKLMKEKKAVLCSTARMLVNPDGSSMNKIIPVPELITYRTLLKHNCINCSSVLLFREVALEFPMEHEDSHEDYIMWMRILQKYKKACAVNEPLLNYRLSSTGKSGSKLKSAKMTFKSYRYMGFGLIKSLLCFCSYAIHGVLKYR
ncbi:MAG: glycosyltransferase family 2 protein [Lachnospiraceae bacterium]|nr:glycosyltransferase family 2 protein [Lachnospiraceae bacterium]